MNLAGQKRAAPGHVVLRVIEYQAGGGGEVIRLLTDLPGPAECSRHYNGHRPHQGLQHEPPLRQPGQVVDITARIERTQVLGSLISEYRRAA
jgi:hypothetical protein